ncbi:MAG: thermonuclease family protein [Paracoccaceae bacterium]|nr:thermonuclease family protein [Paracoccaceae bacterium]NCW53925.1 thermonuclease family protein [Paracoccaceae bacterium]
MTLCAADIRHTARFALRYLLVCLSFAVSLLSACAPVSDLRPTDLGVRVIDGDSLKINGENIRLVGFNAPEIWLSRCEYEKELGLAAKAKLQSIILQSKDVRLDFERKKDGSFKRDKYGRLLAVFYADGRDVADIMTNARLAEYYDGTGRRRNWCDA